MKTKKILFCALAALSIAALSSCKKSNDGADAESVDYLENNYLGYVSVVADVLNTDTYRVYAYWVGSDNVGKNVSAEIVEALADYTSGITAAGFQDYFINLSNPSSYASYKAVIDQIIDGAYDIANEVAEAKIGEPYDQGNVYGVESWYSFNSFTDYADNIRSIENAIMGGPSTNRSETNSVYALASATSDAGKTAADNVKNLITSSINQLESFDTSFRDIVLAKKNGTDNAQLQEARNTISQLATALLNLKQYIPEDVEGKAVVEQYVNYTVLPTYLDLFEEATVLNSLVAAYSADPTQANLNAVCEQWKATREPWELSEAFLFGPVADYQIDPHLDSWPLSQININAILGGSFDWDSETGDSFGASTLGFHTLEYLVFKNGAPRSVSELFAKDGYVTIEATGTY